MHQTVGMSEKPILNVNPLPDITSEVVEIVRDLIKIDTSNYGDGSGPGEALAAEYVEAKLKEVGIDCKRYETTSAKRQGVNARIPGKNPERPALLLHGHLDVVPAQAKDWTYDPFAAEIHDGMIWGRGAVDMKDGDGILLAMVRAWARNGVQPDRDIILDFLPDEEAGSEHGSAWLVKKHPEWYRDAIKQLAKLVASP